MFKPSELHVSTLILESIEGFPFEFGLGSKMVQEMGSSAEGSKNPTTHTNTSKSMEEVVGKVMHVDEAAQLFQTMAIVSLNMENLTLEVNSLKNRLATREKEKSILHEELYKERNFLKGYTHNVEIWRKNRAKT
jgi:hypothetical protein